jgi:hypothetical protein
VADFEQALTAHRQGRHDQAETDLIRVAGAALDLHEWVIGLYLGTLHPQGTVRDEYNSLTHESPPASFHRLLKLMERRAIPPISGDLLRSLDEGRSFRNLHHHRGAVPSVSEALGALQAARLLLVNYLDATPEEAPEPRNLDGDLATKRARYLEALVREMDGLDFSGLVSVVLGGATPRLSDVFVEPQLRLLERTEGQEEVKPKTVKRWVPGQRYKVEVCEGGSDQLLSKLIEKRSLVLLAEAGAGKTTLARYAVERVAAGDALPPELGGVLPVFVRVPELAAELESSRVMRLREFLVKRHCPEYSDVLASAIEQGSILVVIDGLDEARTREMRQLVVDRAREFLSSHKGARLLLTSRKDGYQDNALNEDAWVMEVLPFDDMRVAEFLKKLAAASSPAVGRVLETANQTIRQTPALKELASSPLILSVIAMEVAAGGPAPRSRFEACRAAIETLARKWPLKKAKLDDRETEEVLESLSYVGYDLLQSGSGTRCTEMCALKSLMRMDGRGEREAKALLRRIEQGTGLLRVDGIDDGGRPLYAIWHALLVEYLAAAGMAERWRKGTSDVSDWLAEERLLVAVEMAAGHLQRRSDEDASAFVRELAGGGASGAGVAARLRRWLRLPERVWCDVAGILVDDFVEGGQSVTLEALKPFIDDDSVPADSVTASDEDTPDSRVRKAILRLAMGQTDDMTLAAVCSFCFGSGLDVKHLKSVLGGDGWMERLFNLVAEDWRQEPVGMLTFPFYCDRNNIWLVARNYLYADNTGKSFAVSASLVARLREFGVLPIDIPGLLSLEGIDAPDLVWLDSRDIERLSDRSLARLLAGPYPDGASAAAMLSSEATTFGRRLLATGLDAGVPEEDRVMALRALRHLLPKLARAGADAQDDPKGLLGGELEAWVDSLVAAASDDAVPGVRIAAFDALDGAILSPPMQNARFIALLSNPEDADSLLRHALDAISRGPTDVANGPRDPTRKDLFGVEVWGDGIPSPELAAAIRGLLLHPSADVRCRAAMASLQLRCAIHDDDVPPMAEAFLSAMIDPDSGIHDIGERGTRCLLCLASVTSPEASEAVADAIIVLLRDPVGRERVCEWADESPLQEDLCERVPFRNSRIARRLCGMMDESDPRIVYFAYQLAAGLSEPGGSVLTEAHTAAYRQAVREIFNDFGFGFRYKDYEEWLEDQW